MCNQSDVLRKATSVDFIEGRTGVYEDNVHEPDVLEAVLRFMYTLPHAAPKGESVALFHAKVYAAGEYYGLRALKTVAAIDFKLGLVVSGALGTRTIIPTIEYVYGSTIESDRGLRDIVVQWAKRDPRVIRVGAANARDDEHMLSSLLEAAPEFGRDLIVAHSEAVQRKRRFQCIVPECGACIEVEFCKNRRVPPCGMVLSCPCCGSEAKLESLPWEPD